MTLIKWQKNVGSCEITSISIRQRILYFKNVLPRLYNRQVFDISNIYNDKSTMYQNIVKTKCLQVPYAVTFSFSSAFGYSISIDIKNSTEGEKTCV